MFSRSDTLWAGRIGRTWVSFNCAVTLGLLILTGGFTAGQSPSSAHGLRWNASAPVQTLLTDRPPTVVLERAPTVLMQRAPTVVIERSTPAEARSPPAWMPTPLAQATALEPATPTDAATPLVGPGLKSPAVTTWQTPAPVEPSPPVTTSGPRTSGPSHDDLSLNSSWRHGLRFEADDKSYSLFVGGRAQFDTVGYITTRSIRQNIPGTTPLEDGVSFRRLRLDVGGTIYKTIEFYTQVDFANGFLAVPGQNRVTNATYPTDVWVTFRELPVVGNVRVGNHKPWYSFEHLTSSRFLNFLERSPGFDAFAEGFNNGFEPGISAFDTYADKRGTWAAGLFKTTRAPFGWNVGRNENEVNGRVTYLPLYEDAGRTLLHVGVGAAHRDLDEGQARFRARLDARNSPGTFASMVADTGLMLGSRQQLLIPELVAVAGPLSFQSEYYASWVSGVSTASADNRPLAPLGTVYFQSWYAEVHYFLTGEHREYNRDAGTFTRVVPRNRLQWDRNGFTGWGAWQVAARYSYLDLNSKGIIGGEVQDMTLGLNWFLNPNAQVQFNYFLADRDVPGTVGDGLIHGFATRMAINF